MSRNVLVFVGALLLGLALAWLLLGPRPGDSSGDPLDRDSGAGTEASGLEAGVGPDGEAAVDPDRGPVLFGLRPDERIGKGGVEGRVADVKDAAGIADARLVLVGTGFGGETVAARGASSEDGGFALVGVPAGDDYVLRVAAEGWPERTLPGIAVRDGIVAHVGDVWLGQQLAFAGRVVDSSGRGVANADVRVHAGHFSLPELMGRMAELFSDLDREPEPLARVRTTADGGFAFEALDPGPVTVTVYASGHAPGYLTAVVAPRPDDARPFEIRLSEGTIVAGRVVDGSGVGIGGARIAVLAGNDPAAFLYGRVFSETLRDGSFRIDTAVSGADVQLLTSCPGYPLTMTRTEAGREDVEVVLEAGSTLVVRIVAAPDDLPLDGAFVMLGLSETGEMSPDGPASMASGKTDRVGVLELAVHPGKLQMVMVDHPEHAAGMWMGGAVGGMVPGLMEGPADASVPKGRHEVTFRLKEVVEVVGTVTDEATGEVIEGARVSALGGMQMGRATRSAADGSYRIVMSPGLVGMVLVRAPGYVQEEGSRVVHLRSAVDGQVRHDVVLQRGAVVTGRVVDVRGTPIAGAQVRIDSGGGMGGVGQQLLSGTTGVTGANGGYILDGVSSGSAVRVLARHPGYVDAASPTFEATSGASVRAKRVVLSAGHVLEVAVVDPTGRPVEGAKVEFVYNREDEVEFDVFGAFADDAARRTDRDGRVRQEEVPVGSAHVTASHGDWAAVMQTIEIPAGTSQPVTLRLTLTPRLAIAGRVLGSDGMPIKGAHLGVAAAAALLSGTSDAEGRFRIEGLSDGVVQVRVSARGHVSTTVEVPAGKEGVEIRLEKQDADLVARSRALQEQLMSFSERIANAANDAERKALQEEMQRVLTEIAELGGGLPILEEIEPDEPTPAQPDDR